MEKVGYDRIKRTSGKGQERETVITKYTLYKESMYKELKTDKSYELGI